VKTDIPSKKNMDPTYVATLNKMALEDGGHKLMRDYELQDFFYDWSWHRKSSRRSEEQGIGEQEVVDTVDQA
jgi:hypothetical protein